MNFKIIILCACITLSIFLVIVGFIDKSSSDVYSYGYSHSNNMDFKNLRKNNHINQTENQDIFDFPGEENLMLNMYSASKAEYPTRKVISERDKALDFLFGNKKKYNPDEKSSQNQPLLNENNTQNQILRFFYEYNFPFKTVSQYSSLKDKSESAAIAGNTDVSSDNNLSTLTGYTGQINEVIYFI